jgi:hypothetical protein
MKMKSLACAALVSGAFALCAAPAQAGLLLSLTDGTNSISVADGIAGDANAVPNVVTWIGTLGSWSVNVSTAISHAPNGQLGIDLNSIDVSSGAGTLTVTMSTVGDMFTSPIGAHDFVVAMGGTTAGSVKGDGYLDGAWVGGLGPLGGPAFSGTVVTPVTTAGPFDLSQTVTITHTKAGISSFDSWVSVSEPATLGLLGLVLLSLGLGLGRKAA